MSDHDSIDADIERLLTGQHGGPTPSDLEAALAGIRSEFRADPPPPVGTALSEFVDVGLIVDKGDLLVTAASNAPGPAIEQVAELPKRRVTSNQRREKNSMLTAIGTFIATVTGKIAVGTTVALAATSGAHAAGVVDVPVLPDVQSEEVDDGDVVGDDTAEGDDTSLAEVIPTSDPSGGPAQGDAGSRDPIGDGMVLDGDGADATGDNDDDDASDDPWEACSDEADAIRDAAEGLGDEAEDAADRAADRAEANCEATLDDDDDPWEACSDEADAIRDAAEGLGDEAEDAADRAADRAEADCEATLDFDFDFDFDATATTTATTTAIARTSGIVTRIGASARKSSAKPNANARRNAAKPNANARRNAAKPNANKPKKSAKPNANATKRHANEPKKSAKPNANATKRHANEPKKSAKSARTRRRLNLGGPALGAEVRLRPVRRCLDGRRAERQRETRAGSLR